MARLIPHGVASYASRHSLINCTLAADSVANGSFTLLAAAFPFVSAIAFLLVSPWLVAQVKTVVSGQIAEDALRLSVSEDMVHLTHEEIDGYIEYAADAVQIFPLALLPVTGAVFAISSHVPNEIALGYLGVAVLVAIVAYAWVLSQPAGRYIGRSRFGYSVVTAIGIASNILGLVMIVIYEF